MHPFCVATSSSSWWTHFVLDTRARIIPVRLFSCPSLFPNLCVSAYRHFFLYFACALIGLLFFFFFASLENSDPLSTRTCDMLHLQWQICTVPCNLIISRLVPTYTQ